MPEIKLTAPLPEIDVARLRPALRARAKQLTPIQRPEPKTSEREDQAA